MYAVFKRELFSFLNSLMAYITIGIFLLACALLLWYFPDTSILDYGYAELNGFFSLVPFLFMFLIPAITMRSFAEERKEGTYVLLATRPLSDLQIILAKYLACIVLLLFALLPTLVYYYSIYQLGFPKGNVDFWSRNRFLFRAVFTWKCFYSNWYFHFIYYKKSSNCICYCCFLMFLCFQRI